MTTNDQTDPGRPAPKRGRPRDVDSQLLQALLVGASPAGAARFANCSLKTVYRRLATPAFQKRLADERARVLAGVIDRLISFGAHAADTLNELLDSRNDAIRLGAARTLVEIMAQRQLIDGLVARVEALENEYPDRPALVG
jgi:hypothetical protein